MTDMAERSEETAARMIWRTFISRGTKKSMTAISKTGITFINIKIVLTLGDRQIFTGEEQCRIRGSTHIDLPCPSSAPGWNMGYFWVQFHHHLQAIWIVLRNPCGSAFIRAKQWRGIKIISRTIAVYVQITLPLLQLLLIYFSFSLVFLWEMLCLSKSSSLNLRATVS